MIDGEKIVFSTLTEKLRKQYEKIYITNTELNTTPPSFPALSITKSSSTVNDRYSTFTIIENVCTETIKVEVCSNLTKGAKEQANEIINIVDETMADLGYIRIFCEPVNNLDNTIYRVIGRWRNSILTKEI